jgi:hypothetical protein
MLMLNAVIGEQLVLLLGLLGCAKALMSVASKTEPITARH